MVQATLQNLACALSLETFVDSLNQLVSTVKFEELAQDTILWIRQIYTRKMSIFAWDYERNRTLWDVIRQLETCLCKDSQVLNQKIQEIWKLQLMYPTEHYDLVLDNICQWESTVELTVFEESSKKRFIKESKYLDKNWRQIHAKSYLEIMQLLEMHLNVRMKDPSWISKGEYLFHALFSINNLMESKKETIMEMYYYFLKKYPQNESKTIIFTALQDMMRSLPEFAFAYLQYLEENVNFILPSFFEFILQ